MLFTSQLKPALKLFWQNRTLAALCSLIDIVFLFIIGFVHFEILKRLQEHIDAIIAEMQKKTTELLMQEDIAQLRAALMKSSTYMSAYHQILQYIMIILLTLFISWIVLQNINWYFASKMVNKKTGFAKYTKKFALYTIIWFVCFLMILLIFSNLTSYSMSQFLPLIGQTGVNIITIILVWILAYFAFISYSQTAGLKQAIKKGITHWKQILPAHVILAIILATVIYTSIKLAMLDYEITYWLTLAFILFIGLPALTYGRIYILLVINKSIEKDG